MFICVETTNRLLPFWKSISYINLSNVLHMEVEKKHVNFYTIFRPKYSAYRVHFDTEMRARQFAEECMMKQRYKPISIQPTQIQKRLRMDEASPDPLAIAAMNDWEEEQTKKLQ
jgi:hypothetical protein